jgi:propionyl-CoA carboxylase alpha chain
VAYRFDRAGRCTHLAVDGDVRGDVSVLSCSPDAVVLEVDGVARRYEVEEAGSTTFVDGPDGSSVLTEVARFPLPGSQLAAGALVAPLPGTVVKVAVTVGDPVAAGDTLVAIEAMKMEHEVRTPSDGTVTEVHVSAGEQVEAGRLLVVVDSPNADDPDADDPDADAPGAGA